MEAIFTSVFQKAIDNFREKSTLFKGKYSSGLDNKKLGKSIYSFPKIKVEYLTLSLNIKKPVDELSTVDQRLVKCTFLESLEERRKIWR